MKSIGGIYVIKIGLKMKYSWHLLRYRYNKMLKNDCLSSELKAKLQQRAAFHEQKAISLLVRM
jgi:hypothetical protein